MSLSGTSIGDIATYVCDSGFELVGISVLACQNDGLWDNPPPVCQSLLGMVAKTQKSAFSNFSPPVIVSFDPTVYYVKEGVNNVTELILVRSGHLSSDTVVTVTTIPGTATGDQVN